MFKILKKIYFKYIKNSRNITVYLRGKLSNRQKDLLETLKYKYILNTKDYKKIIEDSTKENKKIFLEIGFGNGHHIVNLAKENKDSIVIGSELYKEGIVNTIERKEKEEKISQKEEGEKIFNNLKIINRDGRDVISITDDLSLNRVYILFPDPWQKARHKKRRILTSEFIKQTLSKIQSEGELVLATDWEDYANFIQENLKSIENHLFYNVFDNIINKNKKDNNEQKINIYHNIKDYNIKQKDYNIENIISSTFARRAIDENRNINIFIIKKN